MNTQRKLAGPSSGFVLLEALITLVLITFGFLGILKLQTTLIVASADGRARAVAQGLAEQKIEQLRAFMVLASDHTSGSSPCAAPSAWAGSDAPSVSGTAFTRTWSVDASACAEFRNVIRVNVTWADKLGTKGVNLASQIAWIDPGKTQLASVVTAPPSIPQPPATVKRINEDYGAVGGDGVPIVPGGVLETDGNDDGVNDDHKDRSYVFLKDGQYELVVVDGSGNATGVLRSSLKFITLKGRVLIHKQSSPDTSTLCGTALPIPADIGYCVFPLYHANVSSYLAGTPIDECSSGVTVQVAAYNCYVGQGWYGNLQLYDTSADEFYDGDNSGAGDKACPEFPDRGRADPGAWAPGSRLPYVSIRDAANVEIGRSGMLPQYQSALTNLDYIIYGDNIFSKSGLKYQINRCVDDSAVAYDGGSSGSDGYGLLDATPIPLSPSVPIVLSNRTYGATGVELVLSAANFKPYLYAVAYIHATGTFSTTYTLNLTGTINVLGGAATVPAALSVSASSMASCTTTYVSGGTLTYACKVAPSATGTLTLNSLGGGDVVCETDVGIATLSYSMSDHDTYNLTIKPVGSSCP